MSSIAIAASTAYRSKVALLAAQGGLMPRAAWLAFSDSAAPYQLDATALENEWLRVPTTNSADGPVLTVRAVLSGKDAGGKTLRSIAVLDADGTLMGARVLSPKELEPETEFEFEIVFQY